MAFAVSASESLLTRARSLVSRRQAGKIIFAGPQEVLREDFKIHE